MESHPNDYHISFFKPTTKIARLNRDIVVFLVVIWTIAIFGFQIALKVFEKPSPEPAYLDFEQVWDQVAGNTGHIGLGTGGLHNESVAGINRLAVKRSNPATHTCRHEKRICIILPKFNSHG